MSLFSLALAGGVAGGAKAYSDDIDYKRKKEDEANKLAAQELIQQKRDNRLNEYRVNAASLLNENAIKAAEIKSDDDWVAKQELYNQQQELANIREQGATSRNTSTNITSTNNTIANNTAKKEIESSKLTAVPDGTAVVNKSGNQVYLNPKDASNSNSKGSSSFKQMYVKPNGEQLSITNLLSLYNSEMKSKSRDFQNITEPLDLPDEWMKKKQWMPVVNGSAIPYKQPVMPLTAEDKATPESLSAALAKRGATTSQIESRVSSYFKGKVKPTPNGKAKPVIQPPPTQTTNKGNGLTNKTQNELKYIAYWEDRLKTARGINKTEIENHLIELRK